MKGAFLQMACESMQLHFEDASITNSLLYSLWFNRKLLTRKDLNEWQRATIRGNVEYTISMLDRNKVPFAVQNRVLDLAEMGLGFRDFVKNLYLS
jgi:hypothetical protein